MKENISPEQLLQWYLTAGVDETAADAPSNRFDRPQKQPEAVQVRVENPVSSVFSAPAPTPAELQTNALAEQASTLEELRRLIADFNECPLKETATNMVFGAGNPQARLMIIGEAPGAEEDKQGLPFVGASGHLLDLMLNSIGIDRTDVYISNILPWRPPGNRKPSEAEIALFTPFVRRHIALIRPKTLLLLGGSAVSALMHINAGITKTRGHWLTYTDKDLTVDVMPSFHPAFLLRTPAQKKLAWRDFLAVKKNLTN